MNLYESLHHHQAAAKKAALAGREIERQNHFHQITLCAQRMRELRKCKAEPNRMADA